MFNRSLKNDALMVHQNAVEWYNSTYDQMRASCDDLYATRERALVKIGAVETVINSIANKPKEFDKTLGEIKEHVFLFHQTKEYAEEAYKKAIESGVNLLTGVAVGGTFAAAAPSAVMSIATTFGRATTGRAISTLSGKAATKAAWGWIGRMTHGFATKGVLVGSGAASGRAFLALLGHVGWGITAVTTTVSIVKMASDNKKIAEEAQKESKKIMSAREFILETTEKIKQLTEITSRLANEVGELTLKASEYRDMSYLTLDENEQMMLGTLVNNTLSLAALLNQVVE